MLGTSRGVKAALRTEAVQAKSLVWKLATFSWILACARHAWQAAVRPPASGFAARNSSSNAPEVAPSLAEVANLLCVLPKPGRRERRS